MNRLLLIACGWLVASIAIAAPRTFVASWGNDANGCTRSAPCRSFHVAIDSTDAGGEVVTLDSGAYGPFTVSKSLSIIVPDGVYAGISVASGWAVHVNVAPNDQVLLRGLAINAGPAGFGVKLASAGTLHIERCILNGTSTSYYGVLVNGALSGQRPKLTIDETTVRGFAATFKVSGSESASTTFPADLDLDIRDSSFVDSGLLALDLENVDQNADVTIQRSIVAHGNLGMWIWQDLLEGTGRLKAVIDDSLFAFNTDLGMFIRGYPPGHPQVTLTGNVIVGNQQAVVVSISAGTPDAIAFTRLDNTVRENASHNNPALGPAPPL